MRAIGEVLADVVANLRENLQAGSAQPEGGLKALDPPIREPGEEPARELENGEVAKPGSPATFKQRTSGGSRIPANDNRPIETAPRTMRGSKHIASPRQVAPPVVVCFDLSMG